MNGSFAPLSEARLRSELDRCLSCETKPCRAACPAGCSPADFILAARGGARSDLLRSAELILGANPLGGICGAVCPDSFCVKACTRGALDRPVEIPALQSAIVERAKAIGLKPLPKPETRGGRIAVVGAGPAGLAAAAVLARKGHRVVVFERRRTIGGSANLIPETRLPKRTLRSDVAFIRRLGSIQFRLGKPAPAPDGLRRRFDAVVVASGLAEAVPLGIPGEDAAQGWAEFLSERAAGRLRGRRVAVIGGGAVAADCATVAVQRGALSVDLIYRRRQEHMPLTSSERRMLLEHGIDILSSVRPLSIVREGRRVKGLRLRRVFLPAGKPPLPSNFLADPSEPPFLRRYDVVVSAIGARPGSQPAEAPGIFFAGDLTLGASTVVESVASGKNAALEADAFVRDEPIPATLEPAKCHAVLKGANRRPVSLEADFFGRPIRSPLLLSAGPHTDGYGPMRAAYEHGWAGGVMKTAFDGVPIHVPSEYLFVLGGSSYGNCDNVSDHPLDRVCREVAQLVGKFPDRLTLASTGGPVTGRDEEDRAAWQSNTRKLEEAGAMGIEYSLSCPQGGDGTRGDLVSQDAELTAKIVGWVLETGSADVPKLFKLTSAVTAIRPIIAAVRAEMERRPDKKAGVTLANSIPSLAFRRAPGRP